MAEDKLLKKIRDCTLCEAHLPFAPRPILSFSSQARIVITGQAPGLKAHESGTPWNDASGERLREWLGISQDIFYDASKIAIVPMGFCYPGRGKSGDAPPRPECSEKWMGEIQERLTKIKLRILIGAYAIHYFLKAEDVTETVKHWKQFYPDVIPLPHPSPRNNIWLKKNRWFENELVPVLQKSVRKTLSLKQI